MSKKPKDNTIGVRLPDIKVEPTTIEPTVVIAPRFMLKLPGAEPYPIPDDCIQVVDGK